MVIIHKVQLHELLSNENGDINYYVTIKILPLNHRSFQTKAVRQCKSPEFKEKFEFRVAYEKLQVQSLKMTLCCFDRFSQHEPLGDHTVHLAELEARGLSLSREILLFRDIHAVPKVLWKMQGFFYKEFYRPTCTVKRVYHLCAGQSTFEWVSF